LLENGSLLWQFINDSSAQIYLAGNAKQMPKDVCDALKRVFLTHGHLDEGQAEDYMSKLETSGRFQQETWS
jgi:sulfite reductase alpha subunit-like flavoprotein